MHTCTPLALCRPNRAAKPIQFWLCPTDKRTNIITTSARELGNWEPGNQRSCSSGSEESCEDDNDKIPKGLTERNINNSIRRNSAQDQHQHRRHRHAFRPGGAMGMRLRGCGAGERMQRCGDKSCLKDTALQEEPPTRQRAI